MLGGVGPLSALKRLDREVLLAFFAALVPRLAMLPWFANLPLLADEKYYWGKAGGLDLVQFRPPLWSLALSVPRAIHDDPVSGRLFAVLIASIAVALIFVLARRLFGRRAAWAAAVIAALSPELVMWSHLLWAETLFGALLIAATLAYLPRDTGARPRTPAAAFVLGVALLAKEFALVAFVALAVAEMLAGGRRVARRLSLAALLFLLPTAILTGVDFVKTGRFHPPHRAFIGNHASADRLARHIEDPGVSPLVNKARAARSVARLIGANLARLWGAQSYPLWRMKAGHYGGIGEGVILAFVFAHAALLSLGLIGLMVEPDPRFRTFARACLGLLCVTAIPAFLVSRFRVPFMYLLVISAARPLTSMAIARAAVITPRRVLASLGIVVGVATLVLVTFPDIGRWG